MAADRAEAGGKRMIVAGRRRVRIRANTKATNPIALESYSPACRIGASARSIEQG
jgi:hypothetical protein